MSWTCGNPTCGALVALDSLKVCPACEQEKQTWTLQAEQTRTLTIGVPKARLFCLRGEAHPAVGGEGAAPGVAWRATKEVTTLPKALALGLASRGLLPDAHDLWQARMVPAPADATWALSVTIPCRARALQDQMLEFERRPDDLDEGGAFAAHFLCVHGPEPAEGIVFPGIHVLDVTDDTELGHAPGVEVKGFRRRTPIALALVARTADVLVCSRGASTAGAGATAVAWRVTTAASVLAVETLQALRAERRLPAPRDRLRVRLTPGHAPAWRLRLTPDGGVPTELEFARDRDGLDSDGAFATEFVFVRGPGADELVLPGLHPIDVGSAAQVLVEAPDLAATTIALEPVGQQPDEAWLVHVTGAGVTSLRLASQDGSYHAALDGAAARDVDGALQFELPAGRPGQHTVSVETTRGAWPDRTLWIGPGGAAQAPALDPVAAPASGPSAELDDGDAIPADPSDFCGSEGGAAPHFSCLELPGGEFDFDLAFVRPDGVRALAKVHQRLAEDPARRAAVFGHTDTAGSDDHNKRLSERRARAAFAVLTHDAPAWEEVAVAEGRGPRPTQVMLNAVRPDGAARIAEDDTIGPETRGALERFQARAGLATSGVADAATRRALFLAYATLASPAPLPAERFLGFAGSPFMGCGEFNPFAEGKDAASRRVVVLVFDPGSEPRDLPCRIGDLAPCRASLVAKGEVAEGDPHPLFRCRVFRRLETQCELPPPPPPPPPSGGLLHLSCSVHDEDETPGLLVRRGDGALVGRVGPGEGRREGGLVTYALDPARMPSPCQLAVAAPGDEEGRPFGGTFVPERVRDALEAGSPQLAFALFTGDLPVLDPGGTGGTRSGGVHAVAGGAQVAAPTAAATLMTLRVSWRGSHEHRMVKFALRVVLTTPAVQPVPDPESAATSHCDLSIPQGTTKVVLEIEVPAQHPAANRPVLKIVQAFDVTAGPLPRLLPRGGAFGGLDPRLTLGAMAAGQSALVPLELDLSFLDVTDHVHGLATNPTFRNWLRSSGAVCGYHILESTRSGPPTTFAVVIPPHFDRARPAVGVHLHFQHEMLSWWDNGKQALVSAKATGKFYAHSDEIDYGWRHYYFAKPGVEGSYLRAASGPPPTLAHQTYPFPGWDGQLAASGRQVIVVFPFPRSTSFGVLDQFSTAGVATIERLLRALVGDGTLGASSPPDLGRLAVSGWSSGTDTLWKWATPGPTAVDEIYAFDGKGSIPADFNAWFFSKPDRRLRLVGSGYTQRPSIQIADAIEAAAKARKHPPGRVTAYPRPVEYWFRDPDYQKAWANETLRRRGDPAPATPDATSVTGVFFAGETPGGGAPGVTLEWVDSQGKAHQGTVPLSPCEAAALLRYGHDPHTSGAGTPLVPTTVAEWRKILDSFRIDPNNKNEPIFVARMRHAWSLAGGTRSDPGHVGTFMGHYRLALEASGFPT